MGFASIRTEREESGWQSMLMEAMSQDVQSIRYVTGLVGFTDRTSFL